MSTISTAGELPHQKGDPRLVSARVAIEGKDYEIDLCQVWDDEWKVVEQPRRIEWRGAHEHVFLRSAPAYYENEGETREIEVSYILVKKITDLPWRIARVAVVSGDVNFPVMELHDVEIDGEAWEGWLLQARQPCRSYAVDAGELP